MPMFAGVGLASAVTILWAVTKLSAAPCFACSTTSSPVIGILSQPFDLESSSDDDGYYVAASYVKWLESAGARSIAIPYHASDEEVTKIFHQINGLLLPGGGSKLSPSVRKVWQLARQANEEQGDYFPVWATCLGFEFLVQLESSRGEANALDSNFAAENISLPLQFVESKVDSYVFPRGSKVHRVVSEKNVTMNNHRQGIQPDHFQADDGLTSIFRVTATSVDRKGRPFVAAMETKSEEFQPYFGVQFHPEKNSFEYATYPGTNIPYEAIDHSADGIAYSFKLARFFVNKARRNLKRNCADHGQDTNQPRHEYTDPSSHPLVNTFQVRNLLSFEQVYWMPHGHHGGLSTSKR